MTDEKEFIESVVKSQKEGEKRTRKQSFADLGLEIGEQITIETISPKRKLSIKLMGFVPEKVL